MRILGNIIYTIKYCKKQTANVLLFYRYKQKQKLANVLLFYRYEKKKRKKKKKMSK